MNTVTLPLEELQIQLTNERVTTPIIIRLSEDKVEIQVIVPDDNYIEVDIALIKNYVAMTTRNYSGVSEVPRREKLYTFEAVNGD